MDPATKHDVWQRTVGASHGKIASNCPGLTPSFFEVANIPAGSLHPQFLLVLPKYSKSLEISSSQVCFGCAIRKACGLGDAKRSPRVSWRFWLLYHEAATIPKGFSKCQPLERCNGERKPTAPLLHVEPAEPRHRRNRRSCFSKPV